ncbi:MAG: SLC13 family permease [Desulfuromonadaceae bacterium]|nr:SLC13 family permease [Desulfuromonadaceae bacterium]
MNYQQLILFGILTATLVLFVWDRWRYDLVAIVALLAATVAGLIPYDKVFLGFGHPAVVTVAAILILSRGLLNAGVVDSIGRNLARIGTRPMVQVAALTLLTAFCSSFMNNIGAVALLMPVAIWLSRESGRSPSMLLMPLAFGSLLGGMNTLIGTPPNIIIAAYREHAGLHPFGMFDFAPVGLGLTLTGLLFISLVGWRLTPKRKVVKTPGELFRINEYISEVVVPKDSSYVGRSLHELFSDGQDGGDVTVVGMVRQKRRWLAPPPYSVMQGGDVLMIRSDPESLKDFVDATGLRLADTRDPEKEKLAAGEIVVVEAVIVPGSVLLGKNAAGFNLRERYGINLLAVARQGEQLKERLGHIPFVVADILLLQGEREALQEALSALGCLPLAERGLHIRKPRKILLSSGIFLAGLALVTLDLFPVQIALSAAAVAMVLSGAVSRNEIYKSIDWAVIVLLGAMIPLGEALETTGGTDLIAHHLLLWGGTVHPAATLAVLITGTMLLTNVINNAAAAILTAPIAISLAQGLDVSVDPFLMAVAVGSCCAFLTPIGHQSNALVMEPGGYRFGDYVRMGLPLSFLMVIVSVPLILWFWPL